MVVAAASCVEPRGGLAGLLVLALLAGCGAEPTQETAPGEFDFYVLAISWSPSYCASEGEAADRRQCQADPPHGFIVHGLWPQFETGWPEFCDPGKDEWVPDELVGQMLDIMPSPGLIGHQWRKHGSCSGLSQEDYFSLTRAAYERVALPRPARQDAAVDPSDVRETVVDANPGLELDGVAVTCDSTYLREVRICLNNELAFRACPEVTQRSCTLAEALMPLPSR
jgi:ribonuclease T2